MRLKAVSLGEHFESSVKVGSGPFQTCMEMYEVGVACYSAVI